MFQKFQKFTSSVQWMDLSRYPPPWILRKQTDPDSATLAHDGLEQISPTVDPEDVNRPRFRNAVFNFFFFFNWMMDKIQKSVFTYLQVSGLETLSKD